MKSIIFFFTNKFRNKCESRTWLFCVFLCKHARFVFSCADVCKIYQRIIWALLNKTIINSIFFYTALCLQTTSRWTQSCRNGSAAVWRLPLWIHVLQPTASVPDVFYKPHKSPPLVFTLIQTQVSGINTSRVKKKILFHNRAINLAEGISAEVHYSSGMRGAPP